MNSDISHLLVLICSGFGVVSFLSPLFGSTQLASALGLALDFWTAGGLIRLTGLPSWHAIGVAAALIGLRKLTRFSLKF